MKQATIKSGNETDYVVIERTGHYPQEKPLDRVDLHDLERLGYTIVDEREQCPVCKGRCGLPWLECAEIQADMDADTRQTLADAVADTRGPAGGFS